MREGKYQITAPSMAVVGVRIGRYGPLGFYTASQVRLAPGDRVVVERSEGEALGTVVIAPDQLLGSEVPLEPQGSARRASAADVERLETREETAGARLLRSLGL